MFIDIENLDVGYDDKVIIEGINLNIGHGDLISIMGSNGSGKTTFIKTMARMISKIGGSIRIDGKALEDYTDKEYSKKIALVLTEKPPNNLYTVYDIVALGRYPHTNFFGKLGVRDEDLIEQSLELVGAKNLKNRFFSELSDGEKQKVMIARALSQDTEIIIMDEPTVHLDIKNKIEILSIIRKLCKEKNITVIASLHDIDLALKNSDYVLFVKNKLVLGYGSPESLIRKHSIDYIFDINKATYNKMLGTLEWKSNIFSDDIFVIGGGGCAADIYRILNKMDLSAVTGVLNENDIDCIVAESIGFNVIKEESFMPISQQKIDEAIKYIEKAEVIIDCGVLFKGSHKNCINLLKAAIKLNKKIITFVDDRTILFDYSLAKLITIDEFYNELKQIKKKSL